MPPEPLDPTVTDQIVRATQVVTPNANRRRAVKALDNCHEENCAAAVATIVVSIGLAIPASSRARLGVPLRPSSDNTCRARDGVRALPKE